MSNLKKRVAQVEGKTGARKDITVVFNVIGHDGKVIDSFPAKMNLKKGKKESKTDR